MVNQKIEMDNKKEETRKCLLCLRVPLLRIWEKVEAILPAGHDPAVANRIAERAAKLIATAYGKDRIALCGKKPSALMGAAIYISGKMETGVDITQEEIAEKLKVTGLTIRQRAKQLNKILGLEFDNFQYRKRDQYVCPFCKESFSTISSLRGHLTSNRKVNVFALKARMFNDDGILVDKKVLERLKRWKGDPNRREFYLCPFCERKFTSITDLRHHLITGWWNNTSYLQVKMFNKDGILVDEKMLEDLKRDPGRCASRHPPAVKPKPEEPPQVKHRGRYRITR